MLKTLTLVRHGESLWNASGLIQGHRDPDLSPLGQMQARALEGQFAPHTYAAVFTSDLSRAIQTAELSTGLSRGRFHSTPSLREIDFGDWEGLSPAEVNQRFPQQWEAFRRDAVTGRPPSGESIQQLADRVEQVIKTWHREYAGQSVLAFTHGGVVRVALILIFGLPVINWRAIRVGNTGVTKIKFKKSGPFLEYFDVTSHLLDLEPPKEEGSVNNNEE